MAVRRSAVAALALSALSASLAAPSVGAEQRTPQRTVTLDRSGERITPRIAPPRGPGLLKVDTPSRHVPWRSKVPVRRLTGSAQQQGKVSAITGTANLPIVLVEFTDNRAEASLHSPAAFDAMLFQRGYPYGGGSMADYYADQSGGLFNVDGQVSSSWLEMPLEYVTYAGGQSGLHYDEPNVETLVRHAAAAADPEFNFCDFDFDSDGYVDTFFVVHSGPGAEEFPMGSTEGKNSIWSHKYEMPQAYTTQDTCASGAKAKIATYTIEPEETRFAELSAPGAPARLMTIGVFVHEFGHALGLPDLYDVDYSSHGGVGTWDVMGSGAYGFGGQSPWEPVPMGAWTKTELGWAVPQNVTVNTLAVPLTNTDATHLGALASVYRVAPQGSTSSKEYFLVEMRSDAGDWSSGIPSGVLVWAVNENRRTWDNTDNATDGNRLLEVIQPDGRNDLGTAYENGYGLGDAGDVFPGSTNRRYLDGTGAVNTRLASGAESGVALRNITVVGASALVDLLPFDASVPGDPDPEDPAGFAPVAIEVYKGRGTPAASTLATVDGVSASIGSVKFKRKQIVDYDIVFVAEPDTDSFSFELTTGSRRLKGFVFIANWTTQQYDYVDVVALPAGAEASFAFPSASNYVASDGTVLVGIYGKAKASKPFRHVIDRATLVP